jgi:hypothetical protein
MFGSLSPRWRRLLSSLAYSALVALVAGLGYLTFRTVSEHRHGGESNGDANVEPTNPSLVDFDGFSTRRERSSDTERLAISLRLRLTAPGSIDSYVFVVARNDHVSPRLWAVWPQQGPGGAVTAGGHFRGSSPTTGEPVKLTPSWTRITASVVHPPGRPPFETVLVYVVTARGDILLSRPFAL